MKKKYDFGSLRAAQSKIEKERTEKGWVYDSTKGELGTEIRQLESWLRKQNYALYLQSDGWREKREAVLERDEHRCCACGAPAEHVHHLTYGRIFNEPLYDLVSVCVACHEIIHTLDKKA